MIFPANIGLDQAGTGGSDGIGGELGVGKYMEHSRNRLKASVLTVLGAP